MTTTLTNEAGHGLPELPEPWTIRYHDDATGCEVGPPTPVYTADQMQQYAIDYAATLALSRGVPADMVLVPLTPTDGMWEAFDEFNGSHKMSHASFVRAWTEVVATAALAAPAAAGAQGEAGLRDAYEGAREDLLDWKGRAQRAESTLRGIGYTGICADQAPQPAAADGGVRERALEMLSQAYREAGFEKAATWVLQVDLDSELYVLDRAVVGAIEAALSSHRQAGDGLSKFRELAERAYEVVHHDDGCAAIGGNGDKDCRCDAVPFLRDMESLLALVEKGAGNG